MQMQSSHVKLKKTKMYSCDICTKGFLDRDDYREHHKQCFKVQKRSDDINEDKNNKIDKPSKCKVHGERVVLETNLKTQSVIHKPFSHVCECGVGYYKKCDLDSHWKLAHPKTKYTENVKADIFKTNLNNEDLDYEDKPKTEARPKLEALAYKKLNKTSDEIHKPNKRYESEQGQQFYKCKECPKEFLSRNIYYKHKNKHRHAGIQKFTCKTCDKELSCKASLNIHKRVHTHEKPYKCDQCSKSFSQSGALKLHKMRHDGVKKHHCDQCNKNFFTSSDLVIHKHIHTGEKPFECKTCGKSFADPSARNRHELIHTGLKPHKCEKCPKSFCDFGALYRHKQLHLNLTVRCEICDKEFKTRTQMLQHVRLIHATRKLEIFECEVMIVESDSSMKLT